MNTTIEPLILGDIDAETELSTTTPDGAVHELYYDGNKTLIAFGHISKDDFDTRAVALFEALKQPLPPIARVIRRYALVMFDDDAQTLIAWNDERDSMCPAVTELTSGSVPVTVTEI